jgi:hypothetical protein
MEPGILPVRIGGVGNQLFIVVAAYITAKVHGVPLYIENMVCENHQTVKEDYAETIFSFFGQRIPRSLPYTRFSPEGFDAWSPSMISPGTAMSSYFQYYPAIAPYESEVRELILKGLSLTNVSYTGSAFLHVRRGDYLKASHVHYIQPLDYFTKALEHISAEKILVFSDDIHWVEGQELFQGSRFEVVKGLNELETLRLMSMCNEGAICSNSTFSWWGAFLGAYSTRNPVVVPSQWINTSLFNTESWPVKGGVKVPPLFPDEWIVI